jgi:hypothetical protein
MIKKTPSAVAEEIFGAKMKALPFLREEGFEGW